jgi:CheY-like chemotaxis protein
MLRARPAFVRVPIIFLTTLKSEEDRLLGYRLGVDDYLPKPYELSELASRVDRVVLRAEKHEKEAAADGRGLTGDLEQVGLPSILSFLEVERRSGELRVSGAVSGRVWLREGRPLRAELGERGATASGRQAFYALLDVTVGRFDFHESESEGPDEIGAGISALLLEHARLKDELSSA